MKDRVIDYKKLYDSNDDFHDYVQKYVRTTGKTVEKALREKIVKEVGNMYLSGNEPVNKEVYKRYLGEVEAEDAAC